MDSAEKLIKRNIEETRSDLTGKLVTLENVIRDNLETAGETVENTVKEVKATVQKFSPSYQVNRHPLAMVGGSVAAGWVLGKVIHSRYGQTAGSYAERLGAIPQSSGYEEAVSGEGDELRKFKSPRIIHRPSHRTGVLAKFSETFSDEIQMIKGIAIELGLEGLRKFGQEKLPRFKQEIDRVVNSAVEKSRASRH